MEWPAKRHQPANSLPFPEPKKAKFVEAEPSGAPPSAVLRVVLNPADCNLDFSVLEDGLHGSALYEQGFGYCWSGARANVGINGGKYCFGCKIVAAQPVEMDDTPLDQQHVCRVGISRGDDAVGNLGETLNSFGFGGTGKFSNAGVFSGYGETFGVGDTIICCVDLESKPMASIGFSKNGKWLGIAKQFDAGPRGLGLVDSPFKVLPWGLAVFPHVLLKNVVVQLQFSAEDGLVPQEGYGPWASAIEEGKMIMGPTFPNSSECELIMMVGLPASGKTTWAEKWVTAYPEKRYILLGTNLALDQMKVPGLHRKLNYGERFDRLMDWATGIFNTLLSRASKMPRNFIIDQTNVYKSARKRKLKPFADFHKIAVVVFPKPEEMKFRADKRFREMGKEVPADTLDEMLANYTLPMSKDMHSTDEYFDEVWFPELNREESERYLDEMKANLSLKRDASSNSREGSFQSYCSPPLLGSRGKSIVANTSPPVLNQGSLPGLLSLHCFSNGHRQLPISNLSLNNSLSLSLSPHPSCGIGVGGQWPSSFSTQPPIGAPPISYHSVSSGYPGSNFNQHESFSACHDSGWHVNQSSINHHPNPSPYLGNNLNQFEALRAHHHFGPNDNERSFTAQGSMNMLYQKDGVSNAYSHPSIGSGSLLHGGAADSHASQMIENHSGMPAFPFNPGNVYASQSPAPPDLLATRPPTFGSSIPAQYGSPFGTAPLRPAHGNFPGDPRYPQGYRPSRPGHY